MDDQQSALVELIKNLGLRKNSKHPFANPGNIFDPLTYGGEVNAPKRNYDSHEYLPQHSILEYNLILLVIEVTPFLTIYGRESISQPRLAALTAQKT